MKILGLDHFVITTTNLEACLNFYVGLLGMRAEVVNGRYALYFGKQKINIHQRPAEFLPAAWHPVAGALDLCFEVKGNIEEIFHELQELQAPLITDVVNRNGARGPMRSIYLRDPDGNLVELAEYPKA